MPPENDSGTLVVTAAAATPGCAARSLRSSAKNAATCASCGYASSNSAMRALSTPCVSAPGSTYCIARMLRTVSPATTSSTALSASSAVISTRLARPKPRLVAPRPPSRTPTPTASRDARSAGTSVAASAANSATPIANATLRHSSAYWNQYGKPFSSCVSVSMVALPPACASSMPIAPAAIATSRPSSSRRSRMRARTAPSAPWMASSRARSTVRAIIRFATFTHAISSTSSTATIMVVSTAGVLRPMYSALSDFTTERSPSRARSPATAGIARTIASRSAAACA